GTSGSTHGNTIETTPARKTTGMSSSIEACELVVEAALELRIETDRLDAARRRPCPAPLPGADGEGAGCDEDPAERQHPSEQVEPFLRRLGQDLLAELSHELVLDLALRVARSDPRADELLHLPRDRRIRLVERRVAGRADELALDLA